MNTNSNTETTTAPTQTTNYSIPAAFQRLQLIASKDKFRYNINSVYFDNTNAVATDGRAMAIIPISADDKPNLPLNRFINFPATLKNKIAKRLAITSEGFNVLTPADSVELVPTETAGQFPDYKQVIPDASKLTFKVGLDASLLLELAKALGADKKKALVTIQFNPLDALSPMKVIVTKHDGALDSEQVKDGYGILMPVRFE